LDYDKNTERKLASIEECQLHLNHSFHNNAVSNFFTSL
jgi:hypothetical protein